MEIDFDSMDEEVAAQVRSALQAKDNELATARAAAERRTAIHTNDELFNTYPRAINALRTNLLAEPELDQTAFVEWLKNKEGEYAALNVPDPRQQVTEPQPTEAQPTEPIAPVAGWGSAVGAGQAPVPDPAAQVAQKLSSLGELDADTVLALDQLNANTNGRVAIRKLTEELMDKRPILIG